MKVIKLLGKYMLILLGVLMLVAVVVIKTIDLVPVSSAADFSKVPVEKSKHVRGPDQTYLTYPEWFLVFSPQEMATFLKTNPAHEFPYIEHIKQFWSSYAAVKKATEQFAYNDEYHTMIKVIGYSTSVEYVVKSVYENTVGRVSNLFSPTLTQADLFYAKSMQDYVDFINYEPWYKFDFLSYIPKMWAVPRGVGDSFVRTFERKVALTSEYFFKAAYSRLIGKGAQSSYEAPIMYTRIETNQPLDLDVINALLKDKVHLAPEPNAYFVPRYYPFTLFARVLARESSSTVIKEIAGNSAEVLVSVVIGVDYDKSTLGGVIVDAQRVATNAGQERCLLKVPVIGLVAALVQLQAKGVEVEHVFDY